MTKVLLKTRCKNLIQEESKAPLEFHLSDIVVNGSKRGCSGFVRNPETGLIIYLNTEHSCYAPLSDKFLYRYASSLNDYTGDVNQWANSEEDLAKQVVRHLAKGVRKLTPTMLHTWIDYYSYEPEKVDLVGIWNKCVEENALFDLRIYKMSQFKEFISNYCPEQAFEIGHSSMKTFYSEDELFRPVYDKGKVSFLKSSWLPIDLFDCRDVERICNYLSENPAKYGISEESVKRFWGGETR